MDRVHSEGAAGGSDHVVVFKPDRSIAGRPVVVFDHGYNWSSTAPVGIEYGQTLLAEKYGIPMISSDLEGNSWGHAADTRVDTLLAWVSSTFGCDITRIAFLCVSMGNFTAWPYLADHASTVRGVASILPAHNLASLYADPTYTASIDTAYGGTADSGEITAHDPNQRIAAINTALVGKLTPQIWYSTNDPLVDPTSAQAFAAAIGADLHSQGAALHNQTGFDPALIAAYLAAALA